VNRYFRSVTNPRKSFRIQKIRSQKKEPAERYNKEQKGRGLTPTQWSKKRNSVESCHSERQEEKHESGLLEAERRRKKKVTSCQRRGGGRRTTAPLHWKNESHGTFEGKGGPVRQKGTGVRKNAKRDG